MSDVSRRRRTRLVALGAAAVTGAGGIALVAPGMAHAAQSLIIPSSASVITTANYNHYDLWVTDTNTAWAGDYKVKVTPVTGAAPTVQVQVKGAAAGAAPGAGATNQAAANGVYDLLSAAATDLNPALQNVRVIADAAAASSFKVQVFKDSNGDNLLDASVDAVSNETTVTGISKEDVVIVPTVPSAAAAKGDVITPKATITTTLAYNLNAVALVTFGSVGANVVVHANAASYDATTKVYTGAPQTMTNAGITTVQAKLGVAGTLRVGATSVTATDYQVTAAASEGVKGANQTLLGKIRPGTTTATFKAKITSTRADKSGIPVNIKVTNVDVPATKLTVDGQDASVVASPVTVTRLTDANGEATVQVVDSSALNAETYWVDVNSGGQNAAQIVADYQTAAAGTLTVPSAATGVVAGQVAVEAKVTDQYAQPFSTDVKVLFDNDAGNNTTDNLVAVSAGSATFTYTDTVKNGGDDVLTVNVTDAIGTINAGVTGAGSLTTVKWVTNATPANVAVVASADNSVAALAANDTSRAVDTTGDLKVTDDTEIVRLAATVTNSVGGAVAGTPVTFTGSTGVTFAAEDGDGDADDISEDTSVFSSSLTVNASAAGAAVAYAKVTKTGKATFSAMAGSASKSSEVSIKNLPGQRT